MTKLILSLGFLAALAGSAAAQSTYDASASNIAAGANSGVTQPAPSDQPMAAGVDMTTTGSIMQSDGFDKQRGEQGSFFGANGR